MKPKKFNRINAFIPVADLHATLAWYRDTLGFTEEWSMDTGDGGIRRDDMRLIFCQDPEYVKHLNNDIYHFVLFWFVDNVDEIYEEFKDVRRLPITTEIANRPWGMREFAIRDLNGYLIRISESIADETTTNDN